MLELNLKKLKRSANFCDALIVNIINNLRVMINSDNVALLCDRCSKLISGLLQRVYPNWFPDYLKKNFKFFFPFYTNIGQSMYCAGMVKNSIFSFKIGRMYFIIFFRISTSFIIFFSFRYYLIFFIYSIDPYIIMENIL